MSCHPTHFEGPPASNVSDEQVEKNWQEFKQLDRRDPRAIQRHHKWAPGHEPEYVHPDSGWKYLNVQFEDVADPDQRDLLHGGSESGLPCQRCGTMTRICGEMSVWDLYHQPGVQLVNEDDITDSRRQELESQIIVVLCCPDCKMKIQFDPDFLPVKTHHDD